MDNTNRGYLIVTDYICVDGKSDVSDALQKLIDENPNRTLFFPDGTYLLDKPIMTPADPKYSVDLRLSNFAILKAGGNWCSQEAMVRLGGSHPCNDMWTPGSVYSFVGGIVDGSGIAKGISIDSGRETVIRNVSMKRVQVGVHIKRGANSGSSDADISDVNITGNGKPDSIGVLVEGWDNTFTNMRIANVHTGVDIRSAGNMLRNIHPLYTSDYTDYRNACAFKDTEGSNWYDYCYSDQFGVGFQTSGRDAGIYQNCFCMWYSPRDGRHTAFRADGPFNSVLTNFKIGFRDDVEENIVLQKAQEGGSGVFHRLLANPDKFSDHTHEAHLQDGIIRFA